MYWANDRCSSFWVVVVVVDDRNRYTSSKQVSVLNITVARGNGTRK
jgi:hypothetical protein